MKQMMGGEEMQVPIIDSIVWGSPIIPIVAAVTSLQTVDEIFGTSMLPDVRSEGGSGGGADHHGPFLPELPQLRDDHVLPKP